MLIEGKNAIGSYFRERIDSIERDLSGAYPRRSQILHDAFEAHRTGKYTLSIPVFLSQADGIWYDQFSKDLFRSGMSGATSKAASDSVVISSELDSFQSLVKPSVERLYGLLPGAGVLYAREEGIR